MTTTPQTEAEQDVPLPDGFIMDGLPDGRIEYKRGFLRESDSLLRSCAPAWEARSIYRLHKELRRLDAESKQQRAALERKSEAIQKLWAERDQLRAQVERLQSQPAAWECFSDPSYFDMWAVKRKDSRSFQDAFHVTSEVEAQRLCGLLNGIRQPAAPALVPLSDEQIKALVMSWAHDYGKTTADLIRSVEAHHGICRDGREAKP